MRLRRSRCLTSYWHQGLYVVHPYPHGTPASLHPVAAEILPAFEDWSTPDEAAKNLDHLTPETVAEAVSALVDTGALLTEDSPTAARDEDIARHWAAWSPEASFFPYATQNDYVDSEINTGNTVRAPDTAAMSALFTGYPDAERLLLPRRRADLSTPYEVVLYGRRTHRDFTSAPVSLDTLATLLSTVFGPVDFIDSGHGAVFRRTSPSGGSRQELDAYLGALDVTGLAPGWYHYNSLQHSPELLSEGLAAEEAAHLCADQKWAGNAAFLVVLAARLERMSEKYHTPAATGCACSTPDTWGRPSL
ncbi:SagB/ThcOx family dehydrogenase [Streptomyces paromomycinus]|uniref:Nitroreductase domain-containing protein n=1 Tax=Streptomyces paromomycinus TaxID=92743 RepID=A0A401W2F7_STREY|nr:SagB/ThcOx family dehydrogenase [Streptomyces paromomycinus]GCD43533.1 hypothetical protein GKJPGBOP_03214 [Streptomyces paromomycinus]